MLIQTAPVILVVAGQDPLNVHIMLSASLNECSHTII